MTYKMIDLCAGIGGIRRGFELAGNFENVLSAEIDERACLTYKTLFGEDPTNDITSEEFKQKVERTQYDILLAGFPCQAFSRAGKQEGFMDKIRGTLFFDIADIIKRTRPKAFLLENVDNLISHNKGDTFSTIISLLTKELNYKIIGVDIVNDELQYDKKSFVRNSRYFGIPQNRPRVFIMGFDKDFYGDKIDVLPKNLPSKRESPIYGDFNDIKEKYVNPKYYISSGYLATLKKHKERHKSKGNGFGYIVINSKGIEKPIANALLATGGSGKERNLVYDPRLGIAGLEIKSKQTPLNYESIRVMTPTEWGKLQGFINYGFVDKSGKDNFNFPEKMPDGQKYKQFGNAVTIPVIEEMAKFMKKCIHTLEDREV